MGNLSRDKNGWYDYRLIRMANHGNVTPSQLQATQIQAMIETQDAVNHNMMVQQECVEMQHVIGQGIERAISQTTAALNSVDRRLASIERNQAEQLEIIKRERFVKEWLFTAQENKKYILNNDISSVPHYTAVIENLKNIEAHGICTADFSELADKREFTSYANNLIGKVQDAPQEITSDLNCFDLWYCSYKESLYTGGYNSTSKQELLPKVIRVRDCAGNHPDTCKVLSLSGLKRGVVIEPGQPLLKFRPYRSEGIGLLPEPYCNFVGQLRCPKEMSGEIIEVLVKEGQEINFQSILVRLRRKFKSRVRKTDPNNRKRDPLISFKDLFKDKPDTARFDDYKNSMEQLGTKINKFIDEELSINTEKERFTCEWVKEKYPKLDIEKDLRYLERKHGNDHYPHYSWFEEDNLNLCKLSDTSSEPKQRLHTWIKKYENLRSWQRDWDKNVELGEYGKRFLDDFHLAFLNATRTHLKSFKGMEKNERCEYNILGHMDSTIHIFQLGEPEKYICEYNKYWILFFLHFFNFANFGNFYLLIDLFKQEEELIEEARSIGIRCLLTSEQVQSCKSFVEEFNSIPFEPFQGLVPSVFNDLRKPFRYPIDGKWRFLYSPFDGSNWG